MHACGKHCSVRAAQFGPLTEHSRRSHVRADHVRECLPARPPACLQGASQSGRTSCLRWLIRAPEEGHKTQTQRMLTCLLVCRRRRRIPALFAAPPADALAPNARWSHRVSEVREGGGKGCVRPRVAFSKYTARDSVLEPRKGRGI